MPHLAMLGVGCPLWVGTSANVPNFQGHPPPGAKKPLDRHANCPKKAKNHQNAGCDKKTANSKAQVAKKCQHQQPAAKTSQEHLWACPGKVLVARVNAASQGACLVGATWTYAFFWAGRHFTEISFFGRPACHLANVLIAPKVGCALKCAAWAGDPTQKTKKLPKSKF